MARTRLTYADAVRLLTGGPSNVEILGRLAGGALLLAAPFAPGLALSLFDAKGEAQSLLRDLVGGAPARIRASRGKSHYELIEAAHTVLVASSYFDALSELAGPDLAALELTDDERRRIALPLPPLPGTGLGLAEHVLRVRDVFADMHAAMITFASGLAAAEHRPLPDLAQITVRALDLYRERLLRLAAEVPEIGLWLQLGEHDATRVAVRAQTDTLTRVTELLATLGDGPAAEAEQRLARHARLVLDRSLWRAGPAPAENLSFPTVEEGFVSPRFRIATVDRTTRLGDESWWYDRPVRDDLADLLAACIADPAFTERPLVILGHPGAGKSLLTEVLAARLPAEGFTTVHVPLRRVDPDAEVHRQIEATVARLVKEDLSWAGLCRASDTTKVVLLDGFDELVQATGVAQSHYIAKVAQFQQEEWVNGRPVVVAVTSRTLVMDRTVVPDGTVVVKLEPFDHEQIARWTGAWNAANARHAGFRPLTAEELAEHDELARQPLLLLMLAVHAAESGARLDAQDLAADQVYQRLLDSFIRRQVREKAARDLGDAEAARLETAARHDLSAAAFAMFNRGQQYVSEHDLDRDLEALRPAGEPAQARTGEPLTRAKRTVAGFFFVHVAQADDDVRAPGRRTYEFLHATFAEFLVAEHTVELLDELVEDWRRSRRRAYGTTPDDSTLRTLLSHQPLTNGEQVMPFVGALIDRWPADACAELQTALLELFREARTRVVDGPYRPTLFDAVNRLAAYTANLVLLAVLCGPSGVPIEALGGPGLASTVRLWRSGLDTEAQKALFAWLWRDNDHLIAHARAEQTLPMSEARLIGDVFTDAALTAGRTIWTLVGDAMEFPDVTPAQRDLHLQLVRLFIMRWPTPYLGRMMPFDERLYERWLADATKSGSPPHQATARLLALLLVRDGVELDPALLIQLVGLIPPDAVDGAQPMLATLAVQVPELLQTRPDLGEPRDPVHVLLAYQVALRSGGTETAARLRARVSQQSPAPLQDLAVPSMVAGLADFPAVMPHVLRSLTTFHQLAWSQVRPVDLMAAVGGLDLRHPDVRLALADYVRCRDGEAFDTQEAEAFAKLQALAGGGADQGCC